MCSRKGFTLIELSLALMIFSTSLMLWLLLFQTFQQKSNIVIRQNNIGLIQLRRIISLGKDFEVYDSELCMNFNDENVCFYEVNQRLIQTPGTQIYLLEVENIEFSKREGYIFMSYTHNNFNESYRLSTKQ